MSDGNPDVMDTLAGLTDELERLPRCAASGPTW